MSDASSASIRSWEEAARHEGYQATINPAGQFGEHAYSESGKRQCDEILEVVHRRLPVLPLPLMVLDFGCGDGRVIEHWPDNWHRWAADSSVTMLDHLTDRVGASTVTPLLWDGMTDWDGGSGDFAVVFAVAVLIHHTISDGLHIAECLARLLEPGGLLVLGHPVYETNREGVNWHDVTVWSPADVALLVQRAGLGFVEGWVSPGGFSYADLGEHHGALLVLRRPGR